jgi:hypothetical protein
MIRKILALPLESVHLLGMAFYFAIAGVLTILTARMWSPVASSESAAAAGERFLDVTSLIGRHGWWLAAAAFVGSLLAPVVRGDGKRLFAWIRAACAFVAMIVVICAWGAEGSDHFLMDGSGRVEQFHGWRSDKAVTPWNLLLVMTAVNLILAAYQVTGGAAKKAKSEGGEKK